MNDEAVAASIVSFLPKLQRCVSVGNYMKYSAGAHKEGLGEVVCIGASFDFIVKKFSLLSSEVLQKYSLCPLSAVHYPMAFQDNLVEVFHTQDTECIDRSSIIDVVFIVPAQEVESGHFFCQVLGMFYHKILSCLS
jgi:alpha/beta superfamily hydrolase